MKVSVDFDRCNGVGLCEAVAPAAFEVGADGVVHVLIEGIDSGMLADVEHAVSICPTAALSIEEA